MNSIDDDADRLAGIACELAVRVRDDHPDANARWLTEALPDPRDWFRLAFALAAAVPDDRSWNALTAWTVQDNVRRLRPCGTPAAAERHRYHGEPLCDACRQGERERDRERKRISRATAA